MYVCLRSIALLHKMPNLEDIASFAIVSPFLFPFFVFFFFSGRFYICCYYREETEKDLPYATETNLILEKVSRGKRTYLSLGRILRLDCTHFGEVSSVVSPTEV